MLLGGSELPAVNWPKAWVVPFYGIDLTWDAKGKEELAKNRLGNIGGRPIPKIKTQRRQAQQHQRQEQQDSSGAVNRLDDDMVDSYRGSVWQAKRSPALLLWILAVVAAMMLHLQGKAI
jgi:hypothetical protein